MHSCRLSQWLMGFDVKRVAYPGVALLLLACCASCGSSGPSSTLPIGSIPVIHSPDEIKRPIEAYEPTDAQVDTINNGAYAAIRMCMAGFGIQLPKVRAGSDGDSFLVMKEDNPDYGYFSPDTVQQKGYDRTATMPPADVPPNSASATLLSGRDASGTVVTEYAGKKIPAGGCAEVGMEASGGPPPFAGSAQGLPGGGPKIPQNEPHLASVNASWSACMKSKGFSYATPMAAYTNPKWIADQDPSKHSADEIATAQADISCKESTNLVGVAVAVESAYDTDYIKRRHGDLLKAKRDLELRVNNANALIAAARNV